jgi:phage shock protein E
MKNIRIFNSVAALLLALLAPLPAIAQTFWIDVRSAAEWEQGHLPQAVLIPHEAVALQIAALTTDKQADIRLYCRSGRRAGIAQAALEAQGYRRVTNVGSYENARQVAAAEQCRPPQRSATTAANMPVEESESGC